jgi:general secretion pathway protein D
MRRRNTLLLCLGCGLLAAGCPKGKPEFNQGRKAENLQDYDAAFNFYEQALKSDPENAEYMIKYNEAKFEAGEFHVKSGVKLRERGDLQGAASEFQRALAIDPSSPIAEQELRKTVAMIAEKTRADNAASEPPPPSDAGQAPLASLPPELKPLSHAPINLKMSNDAKIVFDTIAKLAGLTVIYDPEFAPRRINTELTNVTLQQALDIVSLESKAFWKPVTENIIFVVPDLPQKRRDYEEQVVRTFYLSNTVLPQDLTEIVTGLRQILDLKRLIQLNAQNAILIRDTPDKLAIAEKMIADIDKAKPEVVIQVQVLEARVDKMRNLGILPGQTASIGVVPPGTTTTTTDTSTTTSTAATTNVLTLQNLAHLNGSNYSITLPSFTANALLNDSTTKIIQEPEVRSVDGQPAKLRIGDRVPVATGSFQAGVGVGSTGGAGFVNPLVNTQFQYIDVGVNVDITPRVHPNHEVSMKVMVEVSSVTGQSNIGGIQQPIISQRKIEHDIRLREGEASVLGGLIQKTDTRGLNGWPGLAHTPFLRYLFSEDTKQFEDDEILIILTPRIVRLPDWTRANLRPLYSGSETNVQVRRESEVRTPSNDMLGSQPPAQQGVTQPGTVVAPTPAPQSSVNPTGAPAQLHFEPRNLTLKAGQQATVGVVIENVNDLFSIPFLLQYNPAVISVEEVQHGGFLQGGNQEIAIVQRVDKEHGQAIISATRQPNTIGVNGTGTIMGIVIKAIAPGSSNLSIVQVNAKDSQQRAIPLVTSEATLQVQP